MIKNIIFAVIMFIVILSVPYIMNAIQFYDLNKMVPNDDIQQSIGCSIKWVD